MGWLKSKSKSIDQVLAVPIKPKIRVIFNLSNPEKSGVIELLKKTLMEITDKANNGEQLDIPFIPEDDRELVDLDIEEEMPEISEDDDPLNGSSEYIRLGDLLNN